MTTSQVLLKRTVAVAARRSSSHFNTFFSIEAAAAVVTLLLALLGNSGFSAAAAADDDGVALRSRRPFRVPGSSLLDFEQQAVADYHGHPLQQSSGLAAAAAALSKVQPLRFFELSKPAITPKGDILVEDIQLLYHEFANTYGVPPPSSRYNPTRKVTRGGGGGGQKSKKWNKVVLKWSAVCRGRQFDRIAAVWLGGVEIFRTCTAEPTKQGITWEVEKDVTRYASLWKKPQEIVVSLGNVVDSTYTGIINVTIFVHFYHAKDAPSVEELQQPESQAKEREASPESFKVGKYSGKPADVILPISEPNYADGGYWFQVSGEADRKNASLQIPQNAYRAVLEVCVSPHTDDEFWYTNPPNNYLEANNLTGLPGNGSFREVVVSIDDRVVATVWPFVVVYTGGVNPLFWRPAAAIGAFDLPSYDFDITPFVGYLLDGQSHTFSFTVTGALSLWLLQGNLHIWVDPKQKLTLGGLMEYSVPLSTPELTSNFKGLNGKFVTTASRVLSYMGYVTSSFGNLTTSCTHNLGFSNAMVFAKDGTLSIVDQMTESESVVLVKTSEKELSLDRVATSFPFHLYYLEVIHPDTSALVRATIVHSFKKELQLVRKKFSSFSSLSNIQSSTGNMIISVNNTISGLAATQQTLSYLSSEGCYQRSISARNYTVLSDKTTTLCTQTS